MTSNQFQKSSSITVDGITVRLVFAAEANCELPLSIRDMLKKSYLQRQSAYMEVYHVKKSILSLSSLNERTG